MTDVSTRVNPAIFSQFRSLARDAAAMRRERCDLCGETLPAEHRHLLELTSRQIACVCRACSILFQSDAAGAGTRRLIPERPKTLIGFEMSDTQWSQLCLPVNMAFFCRNSADGRVTVRYPSPAGATESFLDTETWTDLVERNQVLNRLEPDIEALLVNRVRGAREHFIAPIDECYRLAGVIRLYWRGLGGGTQVWEEIDRFYTHLKARAIG